MRGWKRCNPDCKPAFMKAIWRWQPPERPAGLNRCEAEAIQRWQSDAYKFPPYQYRYQFLLRNGQGDLRYPNPRERERLMGFGESHVAFAWAAGKAKESPREFIDKQLSLLGDSFAMLSFGWITSQVCKQWQNPLSPTEVLSRLGLAPGATLCAGMICSPPLKKPWSRSCRGMQTIQAAMSL